MVDTRIKINKVVANQLPGFVKEEFPLVGEFLSQYYLSLEGQGSTLDILQNIDQYVKVDNSKPQKERIYNYINWFFDEMNRIDKEMSL